MAEFLADQEGKTGYEFPSTLCRYFEPIYHTKGNEKTFMFARERQDVIDSEIKLCGYFIIITSEKLFRGERSYLGNTSCRVHENESIYNKIFIEFLALIIRNRFYTYLKEQMHKSKKKDNFTTVPAALKELVKI